MSSTSSTVHFRAPKSSDPEEIAKTFSQFGSVKRVLRETKSTSVCWEQKPSRPITYPEVAVEIANNLPVEIAIIGCFSPGEGEQFYRVSTELQKAHATFIDEYNEASAKLANADFSKNDATTIYSFSVGKDDLVFHRHEGHRAITGITGSAGAMLKFSGASPEEAANDPEIFVDKMFIVEIPHDTMFMLRFHGTVYHQFGSVQPGVKDSFFAISVHTNEAGGLSGELLDIVKKGNASIPLLTEPISDEVASLLGNKAFKQIKVKPKHRQRTVSQTKRYMTRTRTLSGGESSRPNPAILHGNHSSAPEPVSSSVAALLSHADLKFRVPVFALPRVLTSFTEDADTYFVEFEDPAAVEQAVNAKDVKVGGRLALVHVKEQKEVFDA